MYKRQNVYLAKVDPLEEFDAVLKDMIRHDEDLSYEQVSQIKFEGAENYTIFYDEESSATYCADDVYFTKQNGKTLPLDTGRIGTYLESLTTLNLTDYVTYNVTEEEAEKMMADIDKRRMTNYRFYTDQKWGMAKNYTLSLNSSELGYDLCEKIIMDCKK